MHWGNASMQEFLYPFDSIYTFMRHYATQMRDFTKWDQIPEALLPLLAGNFDFELIGFPYATEAERRKLVRDCVYLYRFRGIKTSIDKLIELLGFTGVWNQPTVIQVPFVSGLHRTWDVQRNWSEKYFKEFQNTHEWTQNNLGSFWRIESQKLRGTGDGTSAITNSFITPNTVNTTYRMEMKYEKLSGGNGRIGMLLNYVDSNNYNAVLIDFNASDTLRYYKVIGGAPTDLQIFDLSANLTAADYETGEHTLWMWWFGPPSLGVMRVGIDDMQYGDFNVVSLGTTATNKGILVDTDQEANFDDFEVLKVNYQQAAITFDPAQVNNTQYSITLSGTPEHASEKKDFLNSLMSRYAPLGVTIVIV